MQKSQKKPITAIAAKVAFDDADGEGMKMMVAIQGRRKREGDADGILKTIGR